MASPFPIVTEVAAGLLLTVTKHVAVSPFSDFTVITAWPSEIR